MSLIRQRLSRLDDKSLTVVAHTRECQSAEVSRQYFARNCKEALSIITSSPSQITAIEQAAYAPTHIDVHGNGDDRYSHNGSASSDGASITGIQCGPPHLQIEQWLEPWVPKSGRGFVDIGANVGVWTRWLAPTFDHVHAIEPNPEAISQLKNDLPRNVTVHEVAAWDCAAIVSFSRFSQTVHLSAYFQTEGINTGPRIGQLSLRGVPIDSLNITDHVDFIKCDSEGAEVHCLKGAEQTIRLHRPWLLIEIHSVANFIVTTKLLSEWGYVFSVIRDPNYEPYSKLWYAHCWLSCQAISPHTDPGKVRGR